MLFKGIISSLKLIIYSKLSPKKRIRYLRTIGVKIGNNCMIGNVSFSTEPYLITIGDKVSIASGTSLITHDGSIKCFKPEISGGIFGRIEIGNNVFIGNDCMVLPNSRIGNNCIIGSGSIIRGNIPDNSVAFGNPAKVVLKMNLQKIIFKNYNGLVQTDGLKTAEKDELVKKHFNI